jgi:hypothetical protein
MELIAVCDSKVNTAPDFPMGWWSLARSHELQVGEVKSVSALDRELVLYRTRSGAVRVHDAYCPHLGANLGVNGTRRWRVDPMPFSRMAVWRRRRLREDSIL